MACADDGEMCQVFFTVPRSKGMLACPHFLVNKCHFDTDRCKFSHGHIVSTKDLRPHEPPLLENLVVGALCVVKREDGLWHEAVVLGASDGHFVCEFMADKQAVRECASTARGVAC